MQIDFNGVSYPVHFLSDADELRYWHLIRDMANPYADTYQRVKNLPQYVQEIVFVNTVQPSIFPLDPVEIHRLSCNPMVVEFLAERIVEGDAPHVTEDNSYELYVLLEAYIERPQEPVLPEERLEGQAAIDFLATERERLAIAEVEEVFDATSPE